MNDSLFFLLSFLSLMLLQKGSRIDKQWFMIRDGALKTERLLTIVPLVGSAAYGCDVTSTDADATRNALVDLFTALQHPYKIIHFFNSFLTKLEIAICEGTFTRCWTLISFTELSHRPVRLTTKRPNPF